MDLPGYGHAATVSKSERAKWLETTSDYILSRQATIYNLFLLIDARRVLEKSTEEEAADKIAKSSGSSGGGSGSGVSSGSSASVSSSAFNSGGDPIPSFSNLDYSVIEFLAEHDIPFSVVLTKLDAVPSPQRLRVYNEACRSVGNFIGMYSSSSSSSKRGAGAGGSSSTNNIFGTRGGCDALVIGTSARKGEGVRDLTDAIVRGVKRSSGVED